MRKVLAYILIISLLFTSACTPKSVSVVETSPTTSAPIENEASETNASTTDMPPSDKPATPPDTDSATFLEIINEYDMPEFTGLSDPTLLRYVEDTVYASILTGLNSDEYFVENVSAVYVSKEYLDELEYNSQENIYFGYTLSELYEEFEGTKFVFTLGEDGQTAVKAFEAYDDTYDRVLRNVAIGTGVILLCVTVSVVTAGVGAPAAVSVIFAASAKSATIFALSGGVFSGVVQGAITGIQTKDFDQSLKAAALAGSEGFMWGAVTGAITGGAQTAIALKGATTNGLTMSQAATIQKETGYPLDIVKQFHNMDEAKAFTEIGLKPSIINGRSTLIRNDIDLDLLDDFGRNNLTRMENGLNPIYKDATGQIKSFEWHHVGQRSEGTLALLTQAEHDNPALHGFLEKSEIIRTDFNKIRTALNKAFASVGGGL